MKTCFKCQRELPLSDFYKHKQMADGHLNKCKGCARKDSANNRWKNIDCIREYDRRRGNRQDTEYQKGLRNKYPAQYKAQNMVSNAIRDGKLFKEPCEICSGPGNAHHDDYAKPLNVRWLCPPHHHQWHRDNGEGKNRK